MRHRNATTLFALGSLTFYQITPAVVFGTEVAKL